MKLVGSEAPAASRSCSGSTASASRRRSRASRWRTAAGARHRLGQAVRDVRSAAGPGPGRAGQAGCDDQADPGCRGARQPRRRSVRRGCREAEGAAKPTTVAIAKSASVSAANHLANHVATVGVADLRRDVLTRDSEVERHFRDARDVRHRRRPHRDHERPGREVAGPGCGAHLVQLPDRPYGHTVVPC